MKNETKNILIGAGGLVAAFTLAAADYATAGNLSRVELAASKAIFETSVSAGATVGFCIGLFTMLKFHIGNAITVGTLLGALAGGAGGIYMADKTIPDTGYNDARPTRSVPAISEPRAP